ncbi:MAG: FAD binding domain-containing protein [Methanobacteriota archaeon]
MTNTRILTSEFEYLEPKTVKEATGLLAKYGKEAKVLAGGSNLLVDMKIGKTDPKYVIYIGKIPELHSISKAGTDVVVGANVSFHDMIKSPELKDSILPEALKSIQIEIKRMGTIGGNVCNAAPTASAATPLLVLNAKVKVVGENGSRTIPIEEVYTANRETSLAQDELLTEVHIPELTKGHGAAFGEIKRKIKFAAVLGRQGDTCNYCRIAIGGSVDMTKRVKKAESAIEGKKFNDSVLDEACSAAVEEIKKDNWYVREIAKDLFKKVVQKAWEKAR